MRPFTLRTCTRVDLRAGYTTLRLFAAVRVFLFPDVAAHFIMKYYEHKGNMYVFHSLIDYYFRLVHGSSKLNRLPRHPHTLIDYYFRLVHGSSELNRLPRHPQTWLVVPFHPFLSQSAFFEGLNRAKTILEFSGFPHLAPRISWKRGLRNLCERIRSITNRHYSDG